MKYCVKHKHHEEVLTASWVTVTVISLSWDKVQNRTLDHRNLKSQGEMWFKMVLISPVLGSFRGES